MDGINPKYEDRIWLLMVAPIRCITNRKLAYTKYLLSKEDNWVNNVRLILGESPDKEQVTKALGFVEELDSAAGVLGNNHDFESPTYDKSIRDFGQEFVRGGK